VAFTATAGHVLDFDDTFEAGIAHVSAACAPAALIVAARRGASLDTMLEAYATGFETMAVLAAASHPALYDAGWPPTAVCGPVQAALLAQAAVAVDAAGLFD
jgi:2-methylcitrate dehydratase PrpD